ncbi:MAG: hypothetical protein WCR17_03305 [Candidatus Methanomethylophilaceae archaeon]
MDAPYNESEEKRIIENDEFEALMIMRDLIIEVKELIEAVYDVPSERLELVYCAIEEEINELVESNMI